MSGPSGEPGLGRVEGRSALETIKDRFDAYAAAAESADERAVLERHAAYARLREAIDTALEAERAREEMVLLRIESQPDRRMPRSMLPDAEFPPPEVMYGAAEYCTFSRKALLEQPGVEEDQIITWRRTNFGALSTEQIEAQPAEERVTLAAEYRLEGT